MWFADTFEKMNAIMMLRNWARCSAIGQDALQQLQL
jgi:hypothetical protein